MDVTQVVAALAAGTAAGAGAWAAAGRYASPLVRSETEGAGKKRVGIAEGARRIAERAGAVAPMSSEDAGALRARLDRAGIDWEPSVWHGLSLALCSAGLLAGLALAAAMSGEPPWARIGTAAASAAAGWALPSLWLAIRTAERRKAIEAQLADVLELLSTAVSAGYPIEKGMRLASEKCDGPLADEFAKADREMNRAGVPRAVALGRMADRCRSPRVSMFASAVIQATEQGSPLARILESQARIARAARFDELKEKANRIPVKLLLPIGLVFVPCMLAMCVAPTAYELVTSLSTMFGGA